MSFSGYTDSDGNWVPAYNSNDTVGGYNSGGPPTTGYYNPNAARNVSASPAAPSGQYSLASIGSSPRLVTQSNPNNGGWGVNSKGLDAKVGTPYDVDPTKYNPVEDAAASALLDRTNALVKADTSDQFTPGHWPGVNAGTFHNPSTLNGGSPIDSLERPLNNLLNSIGMGETFRGGVPGLSLHGGSDDQVNVGVDPNYGNVGNSDQQGMVNNAVNQPINEYNMNQPASYNPENHSSTNVGASSYSPLIPAQNKLGYTPINLSQPQVNQNTNASMGAGGQLHWNGTNWENAATSAPTSVGSSPVLNTPPASSLSTSPSPGPGVMNEQQWLGANHLVSNSVDGPHAPPGAYENYTKAATAAAAGAGGLGATALGALGAVAPIATSLIGAKAVSDASNTDAAAAKSAAQIQADSYTAALAQQQKQFETTNGINQGIYNTQQDQIKPWLNAGTNAVNQLPSLIANHKDFQGMDSLNTDPSYHFRLDEGLKALQNSAAARGQFGSGNTGKALENYGQQAASQEYQNAFNRYQTNYGTKLNALQSLSGTGQTAVGQSGQSAQNYANSTQQAGQNNSAATGSLLTGQGNALAQGTISAGNANASGYIGQANALNSGLSGIYNNIMGQQWLNK